MWGLLRFLRLLKFLFIILLPFSFSCSLPKNVKKIAIAEALVSATATAGMDPLYSYQWHLRNSGKHDGLIEGIVAGEDINVTSVWDEGNKGDDILVAVVDDGLQIKHPDLVDNIKNNLSWNYLHSNNDPSPDISENNHGTCVAGLLAARDSNGIGVKGVASRAKVIGYNLLADSGTIISNEADAMTRNESAISISNNSWGAADGTGKLFAASSTWISAINDGLANGRGGKGIIYVWAAGNGASADETELDRSDYDGQANYYGVVAVCATTDQGIKAYYSERGSNLWVCAPSSGGKNALATTDLMDDWGGNSTGLNELSDLAYTKKFGGTSGATPIVSGVVALMLKQNANLGWRDVKLILAQTARKIQSSDSDWVTNGGGFKVNYKYGFGVVDAKAAVDATKSWVNVGTLKTYSQNSTIDSSGVDIPDNDGTGISDSIVVNLASSGIKKIEFIEISVNITHAYWGDLSIELSGSNGPITSVFLKPHVCNNGDTDISLEESCKDSTSGGAAAAIFRFGSARHLGETSAGIWTLRVVDAVNSALGSNGKLNNWSITFYGRE
ncbi:MAG: S8 family serine peptidase [Oligoflexia bacterium]|nr:S8 family serine peptidase [Oligoflexia bacterium]